MTPTLLKLTLFLGLLHYGYGIRCYICQSRSNSACQDPIKSYQLQLTECTPDVLHASSNELGKALNGFGGLGAHLGVDLMAGPPGYPYAPMHCQKISYNVGEERVIVRGCQASSGGGSWSESRGACRVLEEQANRNPGSYLNFCDTCTTDACNGSPAIFKPSPLALVFVFLSSSYAMLR